MKSYLCALSALLLFCSVSAADLTTVSGVTYENYKVDAATDRGLVIYHERGMATIPYTDLPDAIRSRYAAEEKAAEEKARKAAEAAENASALQEQRRQARKEMLERSRGAQIKANQELENRMKKARTVYGSDGKCVVCLGKGRYWNGVGEQRRIQRCAHCKGKGIKRIVDVGEMKFRDLPVRLFRCNKKELRNDSLFKLSAPSEKPEVVGDADFCGKIKVDFNMVWDVYYKFDQDNYLRKVTYYYTVDHDRNPYGTAKRLKFDQISSNLTEVLASFDGKNFDIPPKPVKTKVTRVPKENQMMDDLTGDDSADPGADTPDPGADTPDPGAENPPAEQEYEEVVEVIPEEEMQDNTTSLENRQEWKTADGIRIIFGVRKREMPQKPERPASAGQESDARDDGFLKGPASGSSDAQKEVFDLVVMMIR